MSCSHEIKAFVTVIVIINTRPTRNIGHRKSFSPMALCLTYTYELKKRKSFPFFAIFSFFFFSFGILSAKLFDIMGRRIFLYDFVHISFMNKKRRIESKYIEKKYDLVSSKRKKIFLLLTQKSFIRYLLFSNVNKFVFDIL